MEFYKYEYATQEAAMLKKLHQRILKEAMVVCLETEDLYFSHPLKERMKVVLYIYNLCHKSKLPY
ncbi:MAG: hypothetical protein HQL01_03100 [Nitrospirae bacterium]|nr:hypothetical protein [Nitrospirota bacterium]